MLMWNRGVGIDCKYSHIGVFNVIIYRSCMSASMHSINKLIRMVCFNTDDLDSYKWEDGKFSLYLESYLIPRPMFLIN